MFKCCVGVNTGAALPRSGAKNEGRQMEDNTILCGVTRMGKIRKKLKFHSILNDIVITILIKTLPV